MLFGPKTPGFHIHHLYGLSSILLYPVFFFVCLFPSILAILHFFSSFVELPTKKGRACAATHLCSKSVDPETDLVQGFLLLFRHGIIKDNKNMNDTFWGHEIYINSSKLAAGETDICSLKHYSLDVS